uniref:Uncharacterized protein n=1 Tax=Panagrolaimus sp. ES5 TaxID=591445 RepID=A0AC34FUE9_9BILA
MNDFASNVTVKPEPLNPTAGALKAVLIVALFLLTLISSMLAFVLKNYAIHRHTSTSTVIFSLVSCFGGGVFLGTCLLDLLPDSLECVEKAFAYLHQDANFPVAPFFIAAGFLFVLFIEQAIVYAREIIGFSLGIRLVQSRLKNFTVIICCTIFAAQVLVGGFFGLGIIRFMNQSSKGTTHLVSGILQSIACGTFLYITSFEILPHELKQRGHRPLKFLMLILGFLGVALFVYLFPDSGDD